MKIDLNAVYGKSDNVAAREIENEFMIIPLTLNNDEQSDALYLLNETGREIWEHMNGKINLNQLIQMMNKRYNTAHDDIIQKDVLALTKEFLDHNMIKKIRAER